jgi:hypothetical protein
MRAKNEWTVLELSAHSGEELPPWYEWLRIELAACIDRAT